MMSVDGNRPNQGNQEILQAIQALTNSLDVRVESACKKQQLSADVPTFKREGNKQQYNHCEKVLSLVEQAAQSIDSIDIAKACLTDIKKLVKERQKLIRIADRSELGWGVVKEYIADDLAHQASKSGPKRQWAAAAKRPAPKKKPTTGKYAPLICLLFLPGLLPLFLPNDDHFFVNTEASSTTVPASNAAFTATLDHLAPPYKLSSVNTDNKDQDQPIPGTSRECEHSQGQSGAPKGVKVKLKPCLPFWKNVLKASEFVVGVIESGYKIQFVVNPPPFYAKNQQIKS